MVKFHCITLIFIYLVVVAGSVVRMTGSGMGCPDWPKCFDQYIPPTSIDQLPLNYQDHYSSLREKKIGRFADFLTTFGLNDKAQLLINDKELLKEQEFNVLNTWFEYVNRLIGAIAGLFIFIGFVLSWFNKNQRLKNLTYTFVLVVLTAFQAWWGAMVVATNIVPWVLTVHMVIAALMIALQLQIISINRKNQILSTYIFRWVCALGIVLFLIQIIFGTQVRQLVDHWLMNNQRADLEFSEYIYFVIHRSYAILIVLFGLGLGVYNYFKKLHIKSIYIFLALLMSEVVFGKILADFNIPHLFQALHLVFALVAFGVLVNLFLNLKISK